MKHTPGPWKVWTHPRNENEVYVDGANGRSVCYVIHDDDERKEQKADAVLIAAAPDLLEALKAYQEANRVSNDSQAELYEMAEAAIAKAEGK